MTESNHGTSERAPKLVVVTGAGRSGTSTVAGTLKLLGLSIPQPEVRADASNPRGFFEPRWVVDFHKQVLLDAGVATLDARPAALRKAESIGQRPAVRRALHEWLEQALEPQFVVKDPRTFWVNDLWRETAADLGVELCLVTMLRHPAEVVGSRGAYYTKNRTDAERKSRETGLLAGWVNVALHNERVSRGEPRVFVHYERLLDDWRREAIRIGSALDLEFNTDPGTGEPHPVDDFIDVNLHRVRVSLDDLDVPTALATLAEEVWDCHVSLADPGADHGAAGSRLDQARADYDALFEHSKALVHDATAARVRQVRARTRRSVERELSGEVPAGAALPRRFARRARRMWSDRVRS